MKSTEETLSQYLEGDPALLDLEEIQECRDAFQNLVKSPGWAALVKSLQFAANNAGEEVMRVNDGVDFLTAAANREQLIGYRNALLRAMALPMDWIEDLKRLYEQKVEENERAERNEP
jgi:Zn-dependent oligopeptidase